MFRRSNKLAGLARRIEKAADTIEDDLTTLTIDSVRNIIRTNAVSRTGRYERAVTSTRVGDSSKVHDGGIVYGPWLEGVSSRNSSTSFKGHHQFSLSRIAVRREAKTIARAEIHRALRGG